MEADGVPLPKPWLISEDCHVNANAIMACFYKRMGKGDYILFEDTHVAVPDDAYMSAEDMASYKTGTFAVEKLRLVDEAMLPLGDEFLIDTTIQDMYGYNAATHINSVFVKTR